MARYCLTCRYPLDQLSRPSCPECGRVFIYGDPKTYTTHLNPDWEKFKRAMRRVRWFAVPPLMVWIWFITYGVRTWDISSGILIDLGLDLLIAVLLGGAPFLLILWIGVDWKSYLAAIILCIGIPIAATESLAHLEEHLFVAQCKANPQALHSNGGNYSKDRWWPNGNSFLGYDPSTGRLFGGD